MKKFLKVLGIVTAVLAGLACAKVIVEIMQSSCKKYYEVDRGF